MFRFLFRLIRYALVAALAAAGIAKLVLESRAEPDTEELDMVSIFQGTNLASTADPFYGGRVTAMFSGTMLDLRRAQPAPTGVHLDIALCCAGLQIVVPVGWRLSSNANFIGAGLSDMSATSADPDAPILHLSGFAVASGVQIVSKPTVEVVS